MIRDKVKEKINNFWVAISFFSQIPIPRSVHFSEKSLSSVSLYFVLIGWIIGLMTASVCYISQYVFNIDIAIWFSLIFAIVITGALHEDGLADCCDGFAGGFSKEKKLQIMKDSQIGTYACLGLISAILGKYLLLSSQVDIYLALLVAAPLSRAFAISYMFDLAYVSLKKSKSKQHVKKLSIPELLIIIASILPVFFLIKLTSLLVLLGLLLLIRIFLKQLFLRQLKGYNGDCIGASQQFFELSIYLLLLLTIMQ